MASASAPDARRELAANASAAQACRCVPCPYRGAATACGAAGNGSAGAAKASGAWASASGGAEKTGGAAADAQSESSATAPESSAVAASRAKGKRGGAEAGSLDDGWTKVEAKKTARAQQKASGSGAPQLEVSTSDAGVTTSVTGTGNSSPVTERTEDSQLADSATLENRRTLAEKLLPKPRKTGVEECVGSFPWDAE